MKWRPAKVERSRSCCKQERNLIAFLQTEPAQVCKGLPKGHRKILEQLRINGASDSSHFALFERVFSNICPTYQRHLASSSHGSGLISKGLLCHLLFWLVSCYTDRSSWQSNTLPVEPIVVGWSHHAPCRLQGRDSISLSLMQILQHGEEQRDAESGGAACRAEHCIFQFISRFNLHLWTSNHNPRESKSGLRNLHASVILQLSGSPCCHYKLFQLSWAGSELAAHRLAKATVRRAETDRRTNGQSRARVLLEPSCPLVPTPQG